MPLEDAIDTTNKFLVDAGNDRIRIVGAPLLHRDLTPQDAILLAAWLVALAEPFLPADAPRFEQVRAAVESA